MWRPPHAGRPRRRWPSSTARPPRPASGSSPRVDPRACASPSFTPAPPRAVSTPARSSPTAPREHVDARGTEPFLQLRPAAVGQRLASRTPPASPRPGSPRPTRTRTAEPHDRGASASVGFAATRREGHHHGLDAAQLGVQGREGVGEGAARVRTQVRQATQDLVAVRAGQDLGLPRAGHDRAACPVPATAPPSRRTPPPRRRDRAASTRRRASHDASTTIARRRVSSCSNSRTINAPVRAVDAQCTWRIESPDRYSRMPRYSGPWPRRGAEWRARSVVVDGADERERAQGHDHRQDQRGRPFGRHGPAMLGDAERARRSGPPRARRPAGRGAPPGASWRSPPARPAAGSARPPSRCRGSRPPRSSASRMPRPVFVMPRSTRASSPWWTSSGACRSTTSERTIRAGSRRPAAAVPSRQAAITNNQPACTLVPRKNRTAAPTTRPSARLRGRGTGSAPRCGVQRDGDLVEDATHDLATESRRPRATAEGSTGARAPPGASAFTSSGRT